MVGIGVNVNNEIADEIKDIAISLKQALGKEISVESFFLSLMLNFVSGSSIEDYKKFSAVLGKKITVTKGDIVYEAVAEDILNNGALKLSSGELLYAGEVGLKVSL